MMLSVEELTYEAKSEGSRERDRFSVELIQMAKELVLFCRDTIIANGKAMSHRATFAPQVIKNIRAPTTRAEDRIIEMEEFISTSAARFGAPVADVKHATGLTIDAVRGLMTKLHMAPGLVTEASLETSWLKVKQAVTLLIDNVDKWIISEQEKEPGESSAQTHSHASVSNGSATSSTPSSASVNRILGEVRSSVDLLMNMGAPSGSTEDDTATADENFTELSKRCALALNDLVIAAKRLNLTADASALREANFLFLAGAKLYYHTQTEGSKKDLQKQREQLDSVLQRIGDSVNSSSNSQNVSSKANVSPRSMSSLAPPQPKPKTKQQELKDLLIQRSRAESIHLASMFAHLPLASRVQQGLERLRACQRLIRLRIVLKKWRTLVDEYGKSSASSVSRKRFKCFWEITSSEKTYLSALKAAVEVWMPALRKGAVKGVSDGDVDRLFSNMGTLIESSRNLISEVSRRAAQSPVTQSIGDIFLKLGPWFRLYGPYVNNFDAATAMLKQLAKKPGWSAYVAQCAKEAPGKTELGSYLIMPVQRIPRYELLLKTLIGYTPEDHVDFQNLTQALVMIKDINDKIDNMQLGGNAEVRLSGPLPLAPPPAFAPAPPPPLSPSRSGGGGNSGVKKEVSFVTAPPQPATYSAPSPLSAAAGSRGSASSKDKDTASLLIDRPRSGVAPKREASPVIAAVSPSSSISALPPLTSAATTPAAPISPPQSGGSGLTRVQSLPLSLPPPVPPSNNITPLSPSTIPGTSAPLSQPMPTRVMSSSLSHSKFPTQQPPPPPLRPLSAVGSGSASGSGAGSPIAPSALPSLTSSFDGTPAVPPMPSRPAPSIPLRNPLNTSADRSPTTSAPNSPSTSANNSPARNETPPKPPSSALPPSPLAAASASSLQGLKAISMGAPPPPLKSPTGLNRRPPSLHPHAIQQQPQAPSTATATANTNNTPPDDAPQSSAQMKPGTIVCVLPPYKTPKEARVHMTVDKLLIMIRRNLISKEAVFDFEQEIVFQEVVIQENVPNLGEFSNGFALVNEKGLCTFYCRNLIERESYLNRINGVIKRYQLKAMLEELGQSLPQHTQHHQGGRQRSGIHNMHL